jgi:hypothetical protein
MPRPSRLPATHKLDRLLERSLTRLLYSSSCAKRQAKSSGKPSNTSHSRRYASTLTSSTAINGSKPIPARYRSLYAALTDVRKTASAQLNLSRLQLALQGLESESPPTRVAVLGLNVSDTARAVVRLLLADALEAEGEWEKQLAEGNQEYSGGLLIRYGHPPNPNLPAPRTSIPVLHIPSNVLQRNNVEILVSSVSADSPEVSTNASTTSDAFLSPIVGTPTSASGRQVLINQPVHQTLLVANGLDELTSVSEILASTKFVSLLDRTLISIAVNLPGTHIPMNTRTTILDTKSAEQGLKAIRESLTLASTYEHKWNTSGLPTLSDWLRKACHPTTKLTLISSLLTSTSANLAAQKLTSDAIASSQTLSHSARASLENAITSFSRDAHTELQSGLAAAWSSSNWRKLAWWKLFWRVDDVGLIVSDLVTNAWLPNTEKAVYELSGRLRQVGIEPVDESEPKIIESAPHVNTAPASAKWEAGGKTIPPEVPYPSERQVHPQYTTTTTNPAVNILPMTSISPARAYSSTARPVLTSPDGQHVELHFQIPPQPTLLSTLISTVRAQTMATYISTLTVTAQQLVFRTLSISGLSAGLSGLLYFSFSGGMYEAGTVAAVGTVYALRRMQTDWMKGCRGMEEGLLVEGKSVVKRIEGRMRGLVEEEGVVREDEVEEEMRRKAEEAVRRAEGELLALRGGMQDHDDQNAV